MKFIIAITSIVFSFAANSQNIRQEMDSLPYYEIPDYPEGFSSGNVVSRMVDGLGYRYHWATKSLRNDVLGYTPGETNRTIAETLEHILILTRTMLLVSADQPVKRPGDETPDTFEEQRAETLKNIAAISSNLRGKSEADLNELNIIFQRGDNQSEFPFWHFLNGPLADAIYHTGQIVAFRRAAGNPVDPGMNVFKGKED